MNTQEWYKQLKKPDWAPKPNVFGRVWSILYPIILAVNIYVVVLLVRGDISWLVAFPFWLNIVFNIIFTPLQFTWRLNWWAFIDTVLVLITIVWAMVAIAPTSWIVAVAFVPYLIWVSIATTLQGVIAVRN